jgi:hypothetical protein
MSMSIRAGLPLSFLRNDNVITPVDESGLTAAEESVEPSRFLAVEREW